ncbi:hypothetical protein ACVTKY_004394 [Klebsiella michiganensis]
MLDMTYVRSLIKTHKSKAEEHIKELEGKVSSDQLSEFYWVCCEHIVEYWSHSAVTFLPINTMDYVDYYSKQVKVKCFINELNNIITKSDHELEIRYFEYLSFYWKQQKIKRSDVQQHATNEFLNRVFK